jgi:hypothetical protein
MGIGSGGVIVDIVEVAPDQWWIDTWDVHQDDLRTCAVYCDPGPERPQVGDMMWWMDGYCFWTPADDLRSDVLLRKIGDSGAPHPSIPPADQRRRVNVPVNRSALAARPVASPRAPR